MTLLLFCPDESQPIPRQVVMELRCDGDHGLFPPQPIRFERDGYIAQRKAATLDGWVISAETVLCPECSRKRKGPPERTALESG